eukprot:TRINITY_DN65804_c0_g1_i1.p1 TRINITY_DN65804_c0_g1~~TRINITY_DN65804_c0_g1_i1.p1  ORF type:complete len:103 (-),score=11.04 TRINITY_DN65804_c0_g1_i1:7-315(-)
MTPGKRDRCGRCCLTLKPNVPCERVATVPGPHVNSCPMRSAIAATQYVVDHMMAVTSGRILSLIHISEPTRLLSISYAVFCLKKKKAPRHMTQGMSCTTQED